ncbi:MAG: hypothetical protein HQL67_08075 [Magnetococcales bacterium]|nr:hypothetical protein [Magnetococcales bacterium]
MNVSDNTESWVVTELLAGVIFLLVLLISVPLLIERSALLSAGSFSLQPTSSLPVTQQSGPHQSSVPQSTVQIIGLKPVSAAIKAIEAKLDRLEQADPPPSQPPATPAQGGVDSLLQNHLQRIEQQFDTLDQGVVALLEEQKKKLDAKLESMDHKAASLIEDQPDELTPFVSELMRKADYYSQEQEMKISPILRELDEKMSRLLQERDSQRLPAPTFPVAQVDDNESQTIGAGDMAILEEAPPEKGADEQTLRQIQAALSRYHIDSTIDIRMGSVVLAQPLDFDRGLAYLYESQMERLSQLADALVGILPCFVASPGPALEASCLEGRAPVGLDAILIRSFSAGGNVGTIRINYNLKLANTRSVFIMKGLITARPDLLQFANRQGSSLFDAVGKLAPVGDRRSRRTELHFIMEE